jgi:hypothetical protein
LTALAIAPPYVLVGHSWGGARSGRAGYHRCAGILGIRLA